MVDSKILLKNLLIAVISIIILFLAHYFLYVIPSEREYSNYLAKEGKLALQQPPSMTYGADKIYYLAFFIIFFLFVFYFIDKYKQQKFLDKSIFWKLPLISVILGIVFYLFPKGIMGIIFGFPILIYVAIIGFILSFVAYYKSNSYLPYLFSIIGAFIVVEFRNKFLENIFCYSYWISFKVSCSWTDYGPSGVDGPIFIFGTLVYFVLFGTLISILIKKT